jgi:ketosteroid isomerase-like protein
MPPSTKEGWRYKGNFTMDRVEIDSLLRELYAARFRGDLDGVCRIFSDDAQFRIAGASHGSPISIAASGIAEIRSWLSLMIKTFQITDPAILSVIIEDTKAAGHWRAKIHSRITGAAVATELVDLVQTRDGRIVSYIEFFVPC